MRSDLPKGRIALMLTDIEGSTRLLHRLGAEGYARAQATHRDLLRAAFRAHGGVEVDTQGDAFLYAFPSTQGCLRGAVAGTRALAQHDWSHGAVVKVRMGMHVGEPQPTDEGYVGMVVNTGARISSLGHGGQILLSAEVANELQGMLSGDDVTLRDLGSHRLKDLDEPQRLYQVVIPELPSDFPPPRSLELRPNNLPTPLTPFIGRAQLVSQVRDLVLQPTTRAVTLLGPGGTGKSRLGLRVAQELLHSLDDGAFFVGLAAIRDASLVLPAIAISLGLKEEPGRALADTLQAHLASKKILLLIDNFEQVQSAARDIALLLGSCPGLKVIVTSRQPLRITGERGVPVPTLGLPAKDQPLPELGTLAQYEAVRLFVERAQGARWDFELTQENAADVVEICRRVDALPLAIELATARLYAISTSELLKALDRRLSVLTEGAVDLLSHQQTLRDLVAWSYDLLEEPERQLWRRLAVFAGGGSLDAVDEVCNLEGRFVLPGAVDDLAAKSLLNLEFGAKVARDDSLGEDGTQKRFVMLETLREYAAEQLANSPEAPAVRARHSRCYREFAERARLRGPQADSWLQRLDREQANFREAMDHGFTSGGSVDDASRTAGALWFYWYQRGLFQEGSSWLGKAAESGASAAATAKAFLGLATLERVQNKVTEARSHCQAALDGFRGADDLEGIADALSQLGAIHQYLGDTRAAEACLDEGVQRLRSLGSRGQLSFSLVLLGALKQLRGDLAGAETDYTESLELGRALNDDNYVATALVNLGEVLQLQGQNDRAAELFRESLQIYHALGVRNAVAHCLEMLAGIDVAGGRNTEAAVLFGSADRVRELLVSPVESFNRERYDRDVAASRRGAGEDAFGEAWERGRTMPLAEAVEFAQYDDIALD